ncbi:MAG: hypothetical protein R2911_35335 [Caldilineaceae bacterium]
MGTPTGQPIGSKADLWVMDAAGRSAPQNRTPNLAIGVGGGLQPDMPTALFRSRSILQPRMAPPLLYRCRRAGRFRFTGWRRMVPEAHDAILSGESPRAPLDVQSGAGKLLYWVSGFNQPPDLHVSDLEGATKRKSPRSMGPS